MSFQDSSLIFYLILRTLPHLAQFRLNEKFTGTHETAHLISCYRLEWPRRRGAPLGNWILIKENIIILRAATLYFQTSEVIRSGGKYAGGSVYVGGGREYGDS